MNRTGKTVLKVLFRYGSYTPQLAAVGIGDVTNPVYFGTIYVGDTSGETTITTTNTGNTMIDILLDAYGGVNGDGNAMVCTGGGVGSIANSWLKYNATVTGMDFDDGTMTAITDDPVLRNEVDLYQSDEVGGNSTQAAEQQLNINNLKD